MITAGKTHSPLKIPLEGGKRIPGGYVSKIAPNNYFFDFGGKFKRKNTSARTEIIINKQTAQPIEL